MKYQVLLFFDETRERNYYYNYYESDDTTLGNISCNALPPYQDINKARACYWENEQWVYDEEKYSEIIAEIKANKEAQKKEEAEVEATPTLKELSIAVMDIANKVLELYSANIDLATQISLLSNELNDLKGGNV